MKLFDKEVKKIAVDSAWFYRVIDQRPYKEKISFKIYPADAKAPYYLILFSWKVNWLTNLMKPSVCAKLVHFAAVNGWNYRDKKAVVILENGDFLIDQLKIWSRQARYRESTGILVTPL